MKETRQGYLPLTPLAYLIFVNVGTPKKCTGLKKSTPPPIVANIIYGYQQILPNKTKLGKIGVEFVELCNCKKRDRSDRRFMILRIGRCAGSREGARCVRTNLQILCCDSRSGKPTSSPPIPWPPRLPALPVPPPDCPPCLPCPALRSLHGK